MWSYPVFVLALHSPHSLKDVLIHIDEEIRQKISLTGPYCACTLLRVHFHLQSSLIICSSLTINAYLRSMTQSFLFRMCLVDLPVCMWQKKTDFILYLWILNDLMDPYP